MSLEIVAECLFRIICALILGFAIGYERKMRAKEAGVRTHAIVCIGSCLFVLISKYGFGDGADSARVAAQVVSGIGFLGAGMIFYHKHLLRGLTTAAGIWTTAAVGMTLGTGMYLVALGVTLILILFQLIMHNRSKIFKPQHALTLNISYNVIDGTESDVIKKLFSVTSFNKIEAKNVDGVIVYDVEVHTYTLTTYSEIYNIMKEYPFIISIERESLEN